MSARCAYPIRRHYEHAVQRLRRRLQVGSWFRFRFRHIWNHDAGNIAAVAFGVQADAECIGLRCFPCGADLGKFAVRVLGEKSKSWWLTCWHDVPRCEGVKMREDNIIWIIWQEAFNVLDVPDVQRPRPVLYWPDSRFAPAAGTATTATKTNGPSAIAWGKNGS